MGVPDVEHAKKRLQDILRRAQKLEVSTQEVISTRTAQKLLTRSKSALAWSIWIGIFVLTLSAVVYSRWPVQEVETVRTVLRRTKIDHGYCLHSNHVLDYRSDSAPVASRENTPSFIKETSPALGVAGPVYTTVDWAKRHERHEWQDLKLLLSKLSAEAILMYPACSAGATGDFSERVAALLHSSTQDDC